MQLPKGLYKRGSSYYLDYKDETGKRIRRSAGPDLHVALDLLKSVRGPHSADGSGAGLKTLLDCYLARQRIYSKARSVSVAESSSKRLVLHFGDPRISALDQEAVDGFIVARRSDGVSEKTVNNDLIILRAALNHGVATGLIASLPFKVKLLKTQKRKVTRTLTPEEIERVLKNSSGRTHGILRVAVHTGFRTDEILHLQWRDIGWPDRSIHITTKRGIWSSKNHQERTVFVPGSLVEWLSSYRASASFPDDRDWIFSTRNRTPMAVSNVCRAVRKVFEKAGVYESGSPTIHLIRHTVACRLLSNGVDIETVRDWLGHADIATTSIYLHSTNERKRAAASVLAADRKS